MNCRNKILSGSPSTPKRRRLGIRRNVRLSQLSIENIKLNTPKNGQINSRVKENCDSPPLPCNQVEYLCDSESNSSISSDIPCSPGILETCNIFHNISSWKSFHESKSPKNEAACVSTIVDEIFTDSVQSKSDKLNCVQELPKNEKYQDEIEKTFNEINQSICHNDSFFDEKDSFLLDIRESGIINEKHATEKELPQLNVNKEITNDFYGLPMITKGLFKSYRNIEKFYDWQEECLNLNAIKERRNLIYALPTSGGKTLVAEVLMLREVLVRKKNALFILPFVAIVQEKIWSLSPFAIQLNFLVEEYAAGKGHLPPKKRRKRNSIYVATIEKGLALIRSLIELDRLAEIGLIVVDELHLIGEPGRGGTLETLLSTVIFANKGIQIVAMSATIGNLPDLAQFLQAEVYQRDFRPVELTEYVKLGNMLHKIVWNEGSMELVPDRVLSFDYTEAGTKLDPDFVGGLVSEVVPGDSCLVFCPTKRNCQSVAALLCSMQRSEMQRHRAEERLALVSALRAEGACAELVRCARAGVAFHHAGLAADERALLENAFRAGAVSALCCTSTLAAGVNLPARRVIVRAPRVGRQLIGLPAYRQMVGRAGRKGHCAVGESIIICDQRDWPQLRAVLSGGLPPVRSQLSPHIEGLLLSAVALDLATDVGTLKTMLGRTLLAVTEQTVNIDEECKKNVLALIKSDALEVVGRKTSSVNEVDDESKLAVSKLGTAAIKGCLDLPVARQLLADIEQASRGLVLLGSLHLLYLVSPHESVIRPDYRHYYSLYCNLDEEGAQTAKILGITEVNAIRMMTGKPITNVSEQVLNRFYLALMLRDLWKLMPVPAVADKYNMSRGAVQSVMTSASSLASSAARLCAALGAGLGVEPCWQFGALLHELALRLRNCAVPELEQLMELPSVKKYTAACMSRRAQCSCTAAGSGAWSRWRARAPTSSRPPCRTCRSPPPGT
ncbi:helicase POLQ-like isoform X2 [Zerene cesonia]|uniref:helicase POLQ-like isoform X2 n=1 Tax=Zerene cesonia TaxID=33412 RepID=UPI0018E51744|nr:helicase POLQ-like isoform X2 [Zerene cesonia]